MNDQLVQRSNYIQEEEETGKNSQTISQMKESEIYKEQNENLITNYLNFKSSQEHEEIQNVNEQLKNLKYNPKAITPQNIMGFKSSFNLQPVSMLDDFKKEQRENLSKSIKNVNSDQQNTKLVKFYNQLQEEQIKICKNNGGDKRNDMLNSKYLSNQVSSRYSNLKRGQVQLSTFVQKRKLMQENQLQKIIKKELERESKTKQINQSILKQEKQQACIQNEQPIKIRDNNQLQVKEQNENIQTQYADTQITKQSIQSFCQTQQDFDYFTIKNKKNE